MTINNDATRRIIDADKMNALLTSSNSANATEKAMWIINGTRQWLKDAIKHETGQDVIPESKLFAKIMEEAEALPAECDILKELDCLRYTGDVLTDLCVHYSGELCREFNIARLKSSEAFSNCLTASVAPEGTLRRYDLSYSASVLRYIRAEAYVFNVYSACPYIAIATAREMEYYGKVSKCDLGRIDRELLHLLPLARFAYLSNLIDRKIDGIVFPNPRFSEVRLTDVLDYDSGEFSEFVSSIREQTAKMAVLTDASCGTEEVSQDEY